MVWFLSLIWGIGQIIGWKKNNFLTYFFGEWGQMSPSIHKERRQALLLEQGQGSWLALLTPDSKVLPGEELSASPKPL